MTAWFRLSLMCLVLAGCVSTVGKDTVYSRGEYTLSGKLCKPEGAGPFPVVVFNHGGLGDIIGGAPDETCAALAKAGYVGFSPIRRTTRPLRGHLDDVTSAIDFIKVQPFVQGNRIAVMGFSRGAMLTYQTAAIRRDLKAVVIMAVAVNRLVNLDDAGSVSAPVLLLVAENDTGSRRTHGMNTVEGIKELTEALKKAGKDAKLIVYPPYGSDGHLLFFDVGDYWPDVIAVLRNRL